jgi:integrase
MSVGKITKSTVDKLPAGSLLWDTALIGFGARRQLRHVFYLVRYRINGRQRFLSIGRHGSPWTPDTARTEARRLLGLVAAKTDPAKERIRPGDLFGPKVDFGAEVLRYLDRKRPTLKPRTVIEIERHLMVHGKPLHPLPLAGIDRRTIALLLAEIEQGSGPIARNRVRSSLSAFFTFAVSEGLIDLNPVAGTGVADEGHSRERTLSEGELTSLLKALGSDTFSRIIRLLVLTGQRREEIGGLRWSEVDLQRELIVLPPARTKNKRHHELPLSRQALDIIGLRPEVVAMIVTRGRQGGPQRKDDHHRQDDLNPWVWGRRWTQWSDNKAALDRRLDWDGDDWRLHDLRRTCATMMAELGVLPHIIEAILNHVSGHKSGVAGIYNRARYMEEMRSALQLWGDYVDKLARAD